MNNEVFFFITAKNRLYEKFLRFIDFLVPLEIFFHFCLHIIKPCFLRIFFATKFFQKSSSGIVKNGFNGTRHEKRKNAIASLVVTIKT